MKNTNNTLILNLFFEYGISVNINAYDTHNAEQMEALRKIVKEDAIRFLSVCAKTEHIAAKVQSNTLTEGFWNKALREGLRNAGRKGWRD